MDEEKLNYIAYDANSLIRELERGFSVKKGENVSYLMSKDSREDKVSGRLLKADFGDIQVGAIACYPDHNISTSGAMISNPEYLSFRFRQLCISSSFSDMDVYHDDYVEPILNKTYVALSNVPEVDYFVKNANNRAVMLSVKKEALEDILPGDHPLLNIDTSKGYYVYQENNFDAQLILSAIFKLDFDDDLERKIIYAKCWELLSLTIKKMKDRDDSAFQNIHGNTVASVKLAQAILLKNPSYNIPSGELSERVGLSQTLLRSAFKQVYQETIHVFYTRKRMELAGRLLLTDKFGISAVAKGLGYTHLGHFSARFKERFGILPKDFSRDYRGCRGLVFEDNEVVRYCCSIPGSQWMYDSSSCSTFE